MSKVAKIEVQSTEDLNSVLKINEEVQIAHFDGILPTGQIKYMIANLWTADKFRTAMEEDGERFFLFRENGR